MKPPIRIPDSNATIRFTSFDNKTVILLFGGRNSIEKCAKWNKQKYRTGKFEIVK